MENSTELVIAILILLILFAAVVKIYTNFLQDRELASAKRFLNVLDGKIELADNGISTKKIMQGVNGDDWFLTKFDFSDTDRPDACFEKPCIFICKGVISKYASDATVIEEIKNYCKEYGKFLRYDFDEIFVNDYVMRGKQLDSLGGGIESERKPTRLNYINLPKNKLIEIEIEKNVVDGKKVLGIIHYSDDYTGSRDSDGGKFGEGGGGGKF